MPAAKYIEPYVEHGHKSDQVKKITVSIPVHVLRLLSDERTRRQVLNLRHASNSDLLCEAFLHAFTGQPLPTDEELRRTMAMKKAAKKSAKKAAKKSTKRKPARAKAASARKTGKRKTARKAAAKKAVMAKAARATKASKAKTKSKKK